MTTFFIALGVLIAGCAIQSRVTESVLRPDDRPTPAVAINDGVDCVPMKPWKAFLIQLLNIAGTGPIFGALMGACFGPVVFLWIVFGTILGGAVHDYMSGMISCRHGGESVAEMSGIYLGNGIRWMMRVFSILLLVLTGTVFVNSPAALLSQMTPDWMTTEFWIAVILIYYVTATLLPIDKVIGKLYPVFGVVLIGMAVSIFIGILHGGYVIPEMTLDNMHPDGLPVWPYMFITVACGAISGFHATQSPMMAKCITSEKQGRYVFYGAMFAEAIIALIWAAAGMAFYGSTALLDKALDSIGQSGTVHDIAYGTLSHAGSVLAVIGVIACPITSGDTAFRSARLELAEITHLDQKNIRNRLILTVPLLAVGALLTRLDFKVLWRYFSWANQSLAMITLWVCTAYLLKEGEKKYGSLITAVPAVFMSAVTLTYILMAQEGFRLSAQIAYPAGIVFALTLFGFYLVQLQHRVRKAL